MVYRLFWDYLVNWGVWAQLCKKGLSRGRLRGGF
jgi:hypothetical protein